jgi:hypothetical protein
MERVFLLFVAQSFLPPGQQLRNICFQTNRAGVWIPSCAAEIYGTIPETTFASQRRQAIRQI